MKKSLIVIAIILFSCGEEIIDSNDITIVDEIAYNKTNMELISGKVVDYYSNGRKGIETNYKNGKRNGYHRYWAENGQLRVEEMWENGKLNDLSKFWYENGQLWEKGFNKNGQREGIWKSWYENGQLWETGIYKNGQRKGVWRTWDSNGKLKFEKEFQTD